MRYGYGVDIWGKSTNFGFFDEEGRLIDKWYIATPMDQGGSQILPVIADEIERHMHRRRLTEDEILGIGVGIPGPVNSEGTVGKCVNFGWGLFNLDRALSGLTGLKVKSSNNANMAAIGESWRGNGTKNSAFLFMNYGLGGAVVCNGSVVAGVTGGGGEIGHMILNPREPEACTCGRKGCAEQYISPTGIVRLAKRQMEADRFLSPLSPLRRARGFTYQDVLNAAAKGDKLSQAVMAQMYEYTGRLIANICCVTNPDTVVLGGEFCGFGQAALDGIARAFHKYVFRANENVRFAFASLGENAAIYGAFKTVLDACL